ncbi:YbhB/YbcL family Raf kinase inhibitor-like protein [Nocardiopsis coralliicola]
MVSPVRPRFSGTARAAAAAAACGVLAAGCSGPSSGGGELTDDINVTSTMLQAGRPVPDAFTCLGDGDGVSPPLQWSGQPEEAGSFAVVADDPATAEVLWVVYDLAPDTVEIRQDTVPQPAQLGLNSAEEADYKAPCPEEDEAYDYRFTVYALSEPLGLAGGAPLEESLEAISAHTIARGSLSATRG